MTRIQAEIKGKKISVLGGARSGLAVAALLKQHGAEVFLSEMAPAARMAEAKAALDTLGIPSEFGGNSDRVLEAEMMVLSPGVPSVASPVQRALALGRTVVSELEVASWFCPGPIVAVTGTNGKTTTTTLAGRMFDDGRRPAIVAGNIGTAFSQVVGSMPAATTAILEVSSFQLDHIASFRPKVAVLLNITPDHLDRYNHAFENYIKSKCRVFENQAAGDVMVYNYDDSVTREQVERRIRTEVTLLPFSQKTRLERGAFLEKGRVVTVIQGRASSVIDASAISIRGAHNLANAMAATLAAQAMGLTSASIRATLKNFRGVEHRLEFVRELDGVMYVNDSKATNVDSVWYALQSFTAPIIVLIGGRDKGNDYSRLEPLIRKHVKAVIAIGESAGKVRDAFAAMVPVAVCTTIEEAVRSGQHLAASGDVVLLSPACASFDWFENYEHRGKAFKQIVMNLG